MLLAAGVLLSPALRAHPHVQAEYRVEPLLKGGALTGLRIVWRLDAVSSMLARQSPSLDLYARQNQRLLAPQGYFLKITRGGDAVPFVLAAPLRARAVEDRVELSYEVTFDAPDGLDIQLFDETWFVALRPAQAVLAADSPCRASTSVTVLATQGWGRQSVPVVRLQCGPTHSFLSTTEGR